MKYAPCIILFIGLLPFSYLQGQTKVIGMLKKNIYAAGDEQKKMQAVLLLCDQGYSLHPDTLMSWAGTALDIAKA